MKMLGGTFAALLIKLLSYNHKRPPGEATRNFQSAHWLAASPPVAAFAMLSHQNTIAYPAESFYRHQVALVNSIKFSIPIVCKGATREVYGSRNPFILD